MLRCVAFITITFLFSSITALPQFRRSRSNYWDPWSAGGPMVSANAFAGNEFFPYPVAVPMTSHFMPRMPYYYQHPFTFTFPQPWYKGPNVCVERRVADEPPEFKELNDDSPSDSFRFEAESQSCRGTDTAYICTGRVNTNEGSKMYITKYQCCHGFVRQYDGQPGCVEIDLKDLLPTLRDLGSLVFVQMAEDAGLTEMLHESNFTVLCPTNSALDRLEEKSQNEFLFLHDYFQNELSSDFKENADKRKDLSSLITAHLIPKFLRSDDLENEDVFQTENLDVKIRINVYYVPEKIITTNCVPMMTYNHFARNGLIHMVERVLPQPSRTVADLIVADPQFTILKRLLSEAGMVQKLRDPKGNFTVFAPTDSAIVFYMEDQRSLKTGNSCTASIMKNHITENVICLSAIPNYAKSVNMLGELLTLTRDVYNKLYVDGVQVVVKDIVGINGVVHIIDGLLMPNKAKSITEALQDSSTSDFLELVELSGLKTTFRDMKNVTFFVPANDAIRKIPENAMKKLFSNWENLQQLLLYHVATNMLFTTDVHNGQELETKADNKTLSVNQYISFPYITKQTTVRCAKILSANNRICGGVVHIIDRLLIPPKKTILDTLESMNEFAVFVRLLYETGLSERLRTATEHFTVLAPINDAFYKLSGISPDELLVNSAKTKDYLKMHILPDTVCCEQLNFLYDSGRRQTRSIDGSLLNIERMISTGVLRIGQSGIIECDIAAGNGVVHMLNSTVLPDRANMNGGIYLNNVFTVL